MKSYQKQLGFIIAKSGDNGRYLPLWMHAEDTAGVMRYLINTRHQMLGEICDLDFNILRKTAIFLAYLHDIGKITPVFQSCILKALPEEIRNLAVKNTGEIPSDFNNKIHHSRCGEIILRCLNFPEDLACIVGAHHGMPAENGEIVTSWEDLPYPEQFFGKKAQNEDFWKNIYKVFLKLNEI